MPVEEKSVVELMFFQALSKFDLIQKKDRILVAFSGGADSVTLLHILKKYSLSLGIEIMACHINHLLRGNESKRDEDFCKGLCAGWKIKCIVRRIDVNSYSIKYGVSIETAGRELRYKILYDVARKYECNKIAFAHHLDDVCETLLFRIFRGSGVSSLLAIPVKRDRIIRPILFVPKSEIIDFLENNKIPYVIDSSNSLADFDRNYIRSKIIPLIEKRFPAFREKILNLYEILIEEEKVWADMEKRLEGYCRVEKGKLFIEKSIFTQGREPVALVRRFVRRKIREISGDNYLPGFVLLKQMEIFSKENDGNKVVFLDSCIRIVSSYNRFIIEKCGKKFHKTSKYVKLIDNLEIEYGDYKLKFERQSPSGENFKKGFYCFFNANGTKSIRVRSRKPGDRFSIAKGHTKKIKDFYVDSKFSLLQREESFVLEGSKGKIIAIFVPGYGFRVSEEFYCKEDSGNIFKVKVSASSLA